MLKKISLVMVTLFLINLAVATPIKIVAAENFYGELAHEIGGENVQVQSIINNPNADPHLFATSTATSRAIASAQIIIYNGANYDPWMQQILNSLQNKQVRIINVANLMGVKPGANPHLWYDPQTFPVLARVLVATIISLNPVIKVQVNNNLDQFLTQNKTVMAKINALKSRYQSTQVIATEPIFGYMTQALGLNMRGLDVQWKIMNDTEPSPKMLAQYTTLITSHQVKILFYNQQVVNSVTKNILDLALKNKIAVVGVTETLPDNTSINQWLSAAINLTATALKVNN